MNVTTLRDIELTCPVCSTRFSSQAVMWTNSRGGKRTDFHERAAGAQPLPYFIHLCSRCGYAGSERDFGDIKIGQVALVRTNAFRGREVAGKVSSIAPMVDAGRINRGQRGVTDVNVVEVLVDLVEPGLVDVPQQAELVDHGTTTITPYRPTAA